MVWYVSVNRRPLWSFFNKLIQNYLRIIACQIQSVWIFENFLDFLEYTNFISNSLHHLTTVGISVKCPLCIQISWVPIIIFKFNFILWFIVSQIFLIYLLWKKFMFRKFVSKSWWFLNFYALQKINQEMCCGIFFLCQKSTLVGLSSDILRRSPKFGPSSNYNLTLPSNSKQKSGRWATFLWHSQNIGTPNYAPKVR